MMRTEAVAEIEQIAQPEHNTPRFFGAIRAGAAGVGGDWLKVRLGVAAHKSELVGIGEAVSISF